MNCPKCNVDLTGKKVGSIDVDYCEKCDGVWFDSDELRNAKDETDPDLNWMDFEIWKHADKFRVKSSPVQCPACEISTAAIDYDSSNIEIDYCPNCKGIWLDKDEFTNIIAALTKELLTKSFPEYVSSSLEEAKELITGSESIISEWKDFSTVLRFMQYRMLIDNPNVEKAINNIQKTNPFK